MAYCTNCGNKLSDTHQYCGNCGTKVIIYNINKCKEIIFPPIEYETPIGRSDNPFDVNSPYNFFCYASGLTYLGEINDFTKCCLEGVPWDTYEEAIEYAKKYSLDEKKTCLIGQSLYNLNWH